MQSTIQRILKGGHTRAAMLALLGCMIVSTVGLTASNRETESDAGFTLAVSQAIIRHHTIRLDAYAEQFNPEHHDFRQYGGHWYDYGPLGTSVLSLPFVYVADRMGADMVGAATREAWQVRILSVVNPAVFLVIFLTGLRYVSDVESFVIAMVGFLGSPLASTMSTALWSHNFTALFVALGLLAIAMHRPGRSAAIPWALGAIIFLAYFCRSSSSTFVMAVFAYLALTDRRGLLKAAVLSGGLLAGFMAFSYGEYGQVLPPYYMLKLESGEPLVALAGLLVSPSRGVLVLSPFVAVVLAATAANARALRGERLALFALGWVALHLGMLTLWQGWVGGVAFGPRLLTEAFPAIIALTFVLWRWIREHSTRRRAAALAVLYIALGLIAVWAHTYQALQNPWIKAWSTHPAMFKETTAHVFSWRYPQVLASEDSIREMMQHYWETGGFEVEVVTVKGEYRMIELSDPRTHYDFMNRAYYFMRRKDTASAVESFSKAIELAPEGDEMLPMIYAERADVYAAMGRSPMALDDYGAALGFDGLGADQKIEILKKRLVVLYGMGRIEEARNDMDLMVELAPEDPSLLESRGLLLFSRLGLTEEACQDWTRACELGKCGNITTARERGDCPR